MLLQNQDDLAMTQLFVADRDGLSVLASQQRHRNHCASREIPTPQSLHFQLSVLPAFLRYPRQMPTYVHRPPRPPVHFPTCLLHSPPLGRVLFSFVCVPCSLRPHFLNHRTAPRSVLRSVYFYLPLLLLDLLRSSIFYSPLPTPLLY